MHTWKKQLATVRHAHAQSVRVSPKDQLAVPNSAVAYMPRAVRYIYKMCYHAKNYAALMLTILIQMHENMLVFIHNRIMSGKHMVRGNNTWQSQHDNN